jgi:hypothetical protein
MNTEKAMKKFCPMMFMGIGINDHNIDGTGWIKQPTRYTCIGEKCAWFTMDLIGGEYYPKCAILKTGTSD